MARAHSATTVAELDGLVANLPAASPSKVTALVPLAVDASLEKSATRKRLRSIFGNLERHGAWIGPTSSPSRPPSAARSSTSARRASPRDHHARRARRLRQPRDHRPAAARRRVRRLEHLRQHREPRRQRRRRSRRPVLRIHGSVLFGNIEVHTRLAGEIAGDARKRKRRERKALIRT